MYSVQHLKILKFMVILLDERNAKFHRINIGVRLPHSEKANTCSNYCENAFVDDWRHVVCISSTTVDLMPGGGAPLGMLVGCMRP